MALVKRPKLKMVSRGCLTGSGESITEAKADLSEKIGQALDGSYDPFFVRFGEHTILAWRSPDAWNYRILRGENLEPGVQRITCGLMGGTDRNEFIQSAAYHVLDMVTHDYHTLDEIPDFLTDPQKRRDLLSQSRWQRAYRWARENKPEGRDTDHAWHEWSCWHASDSMFA